MKLGTQIACVPTHAQLNDANAVEYNRVEFGFVTSARPVQAAHFCRFWQQGHLGKLRTAASELTPDENLVEYMSVEQAVVDGLLVELGYQEETGGKDG